MRISTTPDEFSKPYHNLLSELSEAIETERGLILFQENMRIMTEYYEKVRRLPKEEQVRRYPGHLALMAQANAVEKHIEDIRARLPIVLEECLVAKIRNLAIRVETDDEGNPDGESMARRAMTDFAIVRTWRRERLDGIDADHLLTKQSHAIDKYMNPIIVTPPLKRMFSEWIIKRGMINDSRIIENLRCVIIDKIIHMLSRENPLEKMLERNRQYERERSPSR